VFETIDETTYAPEGQFNLRSVEELGIGVQATASEYAGTREW